MSVPGFRIAMVIFFSSLTLVSSTTHADTASDPGEKAEVTNSAVADALCPGPFEVGKGYVVYIATRTVQQKAWEVPTTKYEVTECKGKWIKVVDWTGEPHEPGYGTRWVNTDQITWATEIIG